MPKDNTRSGKLQLLALEYFMGRALRRESDPPLDVRYCGRDPIFWGANGITGTERQLQKACKRARQIQNFYEQQGGYLCACALPYIADMSV